eukprot:TRINITY_DN106001_c0_g1_i1.p2 TRINITY_DN106001_c0_g1~~TRINITY_DN106001_c0_g1_i1.p2  ORF type:complete len:185 (-),score=25.56 TRINITY_DN106001_c0_g1_i1:148-702(-)
MPKPLLSCRCGLRLLLLILTLLARPSDAYGVNLQIIDGIVWPFGWTLKYWRDLTMKRVLLWGGDVGEGKKMARILHLRCALLLIIGEDAATARAAAEELYAEKPLAGVCPPGVDPVVHWDSGSINNGTYVLHLTRRYQQTLGGMPNIAWNYLNRSQQDVLSLSPSTGPWLQENHAGTPAVHESS